MHVDIPDELAERLVKTATSLGSDPQRMAIAAIRRELTASERAEGLLAPVRDAFQSSGMTEDEAVELFEAEKHAARRERHLRFARGTSFTLGKARSEGGIVGDA